MILIHILGKMNLHSNQLNQIKIQSMSKSLLTSSTPEAEVREPPNVAKPHGGANARQGELYLAAPCRSALLLVHAYYHCPSGCSSGLSLHRREAGSLRDAG